MKKSVVNLKRWLTALAASAAWSIHFLFRVSRIVENHGEGLHVCIEVRACEDAHQRGIDFAWKLTTDFHIDRNYA